MSDVHSWQPGSVEHSSPQLLGETVMFCNSVTANNNGPTAYQQFRDDKTREFQNANQFKASLVEFILKHGKDIFVDNMVTINLLDI